MINHLVQGFSQKDKRLVELMAGFDMVNEEDFTEQISHFAEVILEGS
jgi:hypothetical protein